MESSIIIDVRSADEFSQGHLEGALNFDYESPDFVANVSNLSKDGEYFLYCGAGIRAGQAITRMTELGFLNLANGGSLEEASHSRGLPIVSEGK
tara:strand:+ start:186 stop:467 length:282 start_codon:yes stop_codon:yes gene_type:complete